MPVYNAKDTLIKCVGSLVNQTLDDIEIILVNDCSTDNSYLVMQLLEQQFPEKIIIIDSDKNRGAGGARNIGLQYATGEYIGFVDSDDEVATTMYEKLYNKANEADFDIVDCGFYKEDEDLAIIFTSDELAGTLNTSKRNELIASGGYICSKIFKSSYWFKHNFTFRENAILEDSEIIAYAMATAKNIGNVKEILYLYKNTPGSSSKTPDPKKYVTNCYNAIVAIHSALSSLDIYTEVREATEYEMIQMYSYAINILLKNASSLPSKYILDELSKLQKFRNTYISPGYDNKYVNAKIQSADINIMVMNDSSPNQLLNKYIEKT